MYLIILLFIILITTQTEKCFYWKEHLRIACGQVYIDEKSSFKSYAVVDWYWTNPTLPNSIDKFCDYRCSLHKRKDLIFRKSHQYKFFMMGNTLVIEDLTVKVRYKYEESIECLECILGLFI